VQHKRMVTMDHL